MKSNWKERIEQSPVVWLFGVAFAAFVAGFGAYQTILSVSGREAIESGSFVLRRDLGVECAALEKLDKPPAPMPIKIASSIPDQGKAYAKLADDIRQLIAEGESLASARTETRAVRLASWMDRIDIALNDPLLADRDAEAKRFEMLGEYLDKGDSAILTSVDSKEYDRLVTTVIEFLKGVELTLRRVAALHEAGVKVPPPKVR